MARRSPLSEGRGRRGQTIADRAGDVPPAGRPSVGLARVVAVAFIFHIFPV